MTREEAIEWLNTDDYHSAGYNEVLDMAIQALLRTDVPDTNVGDTIGRQAALDAPKVFIKDCNPEHFVGHSNFIEYMDTVGIRSFGNWQYANGFNMGLTAAEAAIEELPSAQPESLTEIQEILNYLDTTLHPIVSPDNWNVYSELYDMVSKLSSVQPERKKGKWIPVTERLPKEERKSYWVCTDAEYQCECRWTNASPFCSRLTDEWHWNIFDLPQYTKVVAWMPLPEPYKRSENE